MKAAIVVLNPDGTIKTLIGPFENGQAAADYSATLAWYEIRMILRLEEPPTTCPYTFSHTREWCGHPECREY